MRMEATQHDDRCQLMTVGDVAKKCRISVRQVWRLSAAGKFPKPLHLGRLARWDGEKLTDWFNQN